MALVCTDCHHLIHDTKQTLYRNPHGIWKLRAATPNETAPPRTKNTSATTPRNPPGGGTGPQLE